MNDMYKCTWNSQLRDYYRIGYKGYIIDKYRTRLESYIERIDKYLVKYKTKPLIFEDGAYNMRVMIAELTVMYELILYLEDGHRVRIDLREAIEDDIKLRYDRKYHTIYFENLY